MDVTKTKDGFMVVMSDREAFELCETIVASENIRDASSHFYVELDRQLPVSPKKT